VIHTFFRLFRTCWLAGRPGGGKTSLAIYMALHLIASGYASKLVANIELRLPGSSSTKLDSVHDVRSITNSVVILDEAWLYLGKGVGQKAVQQWLAMIRHGNQYLLLPSVLPLTDQVQYFTLQRTWNLVPVALPLWVYNWRLNAGATHDKGRWLWWHPSQVFSLYDHTANQPGDTYYVYEFAAEEDAIEGVGK
jgi:hypothetical protein